MQFKFFKPDNGPEEFINKLVEIINGRFVFEIGCGNGDLLMALMNKGVKIIGIVIKEHQILKLV